MKELEKTREEVNEAIGFVIDAYRSERDVLKKNHVEARRRTLQSYNDFYDWLQGEVN